MKLLRKYIRALLVEQSIGIGDRSIILPPGIQATSTKETLDLSDPSSMNKRSRNAVKVLQRFRDAIANSESKKFGSIGEDLVASILGGKQTNEYWDQNSLFSDVIVDGPPSTYYSVKASKNPRILGDQKIGLPKIEKLLIQKGGKNISVGIAMISVAGDNIKVEWTTDPITLEKADFEKIRQAKKKPKKKQPHWLYKSDVGMSWTSFQRLMLFADADKGKEVGMSEKSIKLPPTAEGENYDLEDNEIADKFRDTFKYFRSSSDLEEEQEQQLSTLLDQIRATLGESFDWYESAYGKAVAGSLLREYIRELIEANEYEWSVASKKKFMLDKEGMEQSDKDNQEKYLKSMGLMEGYIRELLKEDPMGFVHDLAAASEDFGEPGEMFFGGDPGKGGGKAIKRAFAKNADHKWLSTLNTVHWGDVYALEDLMGKGKDELSTLMSLPSEDFQVMGKQTGLWVKGRITLAGNDMDNLYTGHYDDYGPGKEGSEEDVTHRDKSSGRNKRPTVSKDYSRYGQLTRGNEYAEKMARNIPYVLDQSMWDSVSHGGEALVDNWKPLGLIPDYEVIQILKRLNKGRDLDEDPPGRVGKIVKLAREIGVPIFDRSQNEIWGVE